MSIPEAQLDVWAKQGRTKQFTDAYGTINAMLEDKSAPFAARNPQVYLQGSYGNDTDVYADSDVDIVCCSDSSFHYDLGHLNQMEKDNFLRAYPGAGVSLGSFRGDVVAWLKKKYDTDVDPPKKAVHIKGTPYRRSADVLVCIEHRSISVSTASTPNCTTRARSSSHPTGPRLPTSRRFTPRTALRSTRQQTAGSSRPCASSKIFGTG